MKSATFVALVATPGVTAVHPANMNSVDGVTDFDDNSTINICVEACGSRIMGLPKLMRGCPR